MAVPVTMSIRAVGDRQLRTNDGNVERVQNGVRSYRRESIQEISVEVRISVGTVYDILQNI
jgi:hypothetical protein